MQATKFLSLVIPVYNEEHNLLPLFFEIQKTMQSLKKLAEAESEIYSREADKPKVSTLETCSAEQTLAGFIDLSIQKVISQAPYFIKNQYPKAVLLKALKESLAEVSTKDYAAFWELIFVDDGSKDSSLDKIKEIANIAESQSGTAESRTGTAQLQPSTVQVCPQSDTAEHHQVRYISFAENYGQSAAFKAGFDVAEGEFVITLDADLQNLPTDIPLLLAVQQMNKADMVIGWRINRQDNNLKRFTSCCGNKIRNWFLQESVQDTGCSLKLMRSSMVKQIIMLKGMHRFFTGLMRMQGAKIVEVPVQHRLRHSGLSKYGFWDRARVTVFDVLALRWMQSRHFRYKIKEKL